MKPFFYPFFLFLLIGSSLLAQLTEKASPGSFIGQVSNNNILFTMRAVEFGFDITTTPDQTSQAAWNDEPILRFDNGSNYIETTNVTDMNGTIIGGTPNFQPASQASFHDDAQVTHKKHVFFIKRSNNKNEVHYDANLTSDCKWKEEPIDHYWRDLEDGPDVITEMVTSFFINEEKAYGFTTQRKNDTEITIKHVGIPDHPITVKLLPGCKVSATIQINNQTATFRSVYVAVNILGLSADYVDILGFSQDGKQIYERYPPKSIRSSLPNSSYWESGASVLGRPQ